MSQLANSFGPIDVTLIREGKRRHHAGLLQYPESADKWDVAVLVSQDGRTEIQTRTIEPDWDEAVSWAFRLGFRPADDEAVSVVDGVVSHLLVPL